MEKITQTAGRNQLGTFAPDFAHFNDDVLFGENWNNPDIDLKTRCIITVVALMSSGITDSSLTYHLENAKAHGVTRAEISAIVTHVGFYVGWPKAWAVFRLAKDVWNEEEPALTEKDKYQNTILFPIGAPNDGFKQYFSGGVKHWHGAAPDSWFSHLAIEVPGENGSNEWLEPVDEKQYGGLK